MLVIQIIIYLVGASDPEHIKQNDFEVKHKDVGEKLPENNYDIKLYQEKCLDSTNVLNTVPNMKDSSFNFKFNKVKQGYELQWTDDSLLGKYVTVDSIFKDKINLLRYYTTISNYHILTSTSQSVTNFLNIPKVDAREKKLFWIYNVENVNWSEKLIVSYEDDLNNRVKFKVVDYRQSKLYYTESLFSNQYEDAMISSYNYCVSARSDSIYIGYTDSIGNYHLSSLKFR